MLPGVIGPISDYVESTARVYRCYLGRGPGASPLGPGTRDTGGAEGIFQHTFTNKRFPDQTTAKKLIRNNQVKASLLTMIVRSSTAVVWMFFLFYQIHIRSKNCLALSPASYVGSKDARAEKRNGYKSRQIVFPYKLIPPGGWLSTYPNS